MLDGSHCATLQPIPRWTIIVGVHVHFVVTGEPKEAPEDKCVCVVPIMLTSWLYSHAAHVASPALQYVSARDSSWL